MTTFQLTPELSNALDDLCSRFILNVPEEERGIERIMFQIEQAQWFYEDFVRPENPVFPRFNLRDFTTVILHHCPDLRQFSGQAEAIYENFRKYKVKVPVMGAILLTPNMEKVLMVKGWNSGSGWAFPRGKINKDESEYDCAIREVLEETGFDMTALSNDQDFLELALHEQRARLYIVQNVPEDSEFKTQTRKEISKIQWWKIEDLPSSANDTKPGVNTKNFYMVFPFIKRLKHWIKQNKRDRTKNKAVIAPRAAVAKRPVDEDPAESLKRILGVNKTVQSSPMLSFSFDMQRIQAALFNRC